MTTLFLIVWSLSPIYSSSTPCTTFVVTIHNQYTFFFFFQKLSYNLLRNSFDIAPQCDLVFYPTAAGKSSFFVVMALTHEPSSKTVMYASTAIRKVTAIEYNKIMHPSWKQGSVLHDLISSSLTSESLNTVWRLNCYRYCKSLNKCPLKYMPPIKAKVWNKCLPMSNCSSSPSPHPHHLFFFLGWGGGVLRQQRLVNNKFPSNRPLKSKLAGQKVFTQFHSTCTLMFGMSFH